ncbi:MAG: aminoacyl-histidine dipeptidase [Ruminococcaceae bacterium]|jgi:dipeptidase D|nr:aminoacyl-histidine dipeptidase [Oscillospiraceae bacterium]
MKYVTEGREPADALRFFEDIAAVPRASGNEAGIAQFMKKFAEDRGLWVRVDEWNNVVIKKPGSKGCEDLPPVMLQGHLDIVPEKNQDTVHDWEKDGLKLMIVGDRLTADGTTLGCDDGYALSYMLAVLDRNDLRHPPLECVMTSMEEIGLIGAQKMDCSVITARRMIGMDAGGEGGFLASSAGGGSVTLRVPFTYEPASGKGLSVRIRGLEGGHSGGMIHMEKGNANKLLGRILYNVSKECDFRLAFISGGFKSNAIPREADCVILLQDGKTDRAREIIAATEKEIQTELQFSDKGFKVLVDDASAEKMFDADATRRVVFLSHSLPNGMMMKSMAIEGLTNASLNVGVLTTKEDHVEYQVSVRSAEDSLVHSIADVVIDIARTAGCEAEMGNTYPAFSFDPDSRLRKLVMDVYKEVSGKEGQVRAVHGGTEAGVFRGKLPGIDICGLGPTAGGAHTPDEWVDLNSFRRAFELLLKVLDRMCD